MNEIQALLEQIGKYWGWNVGNKVKAEIEAVIGAQDVDIQQLQSAIATIQGLLDADPDTPEFDVGQNIVTQLSDHLTRITSLEGDMATLKGDESTVGSVAYAVKQERDRAQTAEGNLQTAIDNEATARANADANLQAQIDELSGGGSGSISSLQAELDETQAGAGLNEDGTYTAKTDAHYIDEATSLKDADEKLDAAIKATDDVAQAASAKSTANEAAINTLNGDDTVEGSVAKTAKDAAEAAGAAAVQTANAYADATFVRKDDVAGIDAATLSSIFRNALDCAFSGASLDDVLNGTGDCAAAGGDGSGGGNDGDAGSI